MTSRHYKIVILNKWLLHHWYNAYPSISEKEYLMKETNLSILQIDYWFINQRKRRLVGNKLGLLAEVASIYYKKHRFTNEEKEQPSR